MKKGKSVKLNLFQPIKTVYGTVESKNLKSLYINIQSWVNPKFEHNLNGREIKITNLPSILSWDKHKKPVYIYYS